MDSCKGAGATPHPKLYWEGGGYGQNLKSYLTGTLVERLSINIARVADGLI